MAMTREQVLAEMEASYEQMDEEIRSEVLFTEQGQDWTPTLLLQEVRDNTDFGNLYVEKWSQNKDAQAGSLEALLAALLGGGMTCGDPDCPNCHGEVRPFDELPGTGTGGTLH